MIRTRPGLAALTPFLLVLILASRVASQESPARPEPSDGDRFYAAIEYQAGVKRIHAKTKGMGINHAAEYRRSQHAALVKKLAEKFHMTPRDVIESPKWVAQEKARVEGIARAEDARRRAIADRPNRVKAGVVGTLMQGSTFGRNYFLYIEASILFVAQDTDGLELMRKKGQLWLSKEIMTVRVIEVYDYRVLKKGLFVRVRALNGPEKDRELFCIAENIEF